jgi:hypothetical protein
VFTIDANRQLDWVDLKSVSAVEIRNYEGDGVDVANLVHRTWTSVFGGKMWFPFWNHPYFSWRLLDERGGGRDFLVSAYKGTQLVGCLFAEPMTFRIKGRTVRGTMSSWLSVDPDIRVPNLALRLVEGLRRRHEEHGMGVSIGCTSRDAKAPNRRFWDTLVQRKPEEFCFWGEIRFWTRVFDGPAVAAAGLTAFERFAPRLAALIPAPSTKRPQASGIRPFRQSDLSRCLDWLQLQSRTADVHMVWSVPRLDLQLNHDYTRTLVLERGDEGGFINYYMIDWSGARPVRVGMIDLFAGSLSLFSQVSLLRAAERRMKAEGIQLAVMMASCAAPAKPLLTAGFVPVPSHVDMFSYLALPGLGMTSGLKYHLLFT